MKTWLHKIAACALAVTTMLTLVVSASAAAVSLPDETSPRTLTIHKYETVDETAEKGTGHAEEVNTSEHQPLSNVVFDVYYYAPLDSDVPSALSICEAEKWVQANEDALVTSLITNDDGEAIWKASEGGSSADGVYLVVERDNRAIQITGKANPFFISLPYTDVDGSKWIYDVVVQPKNNLVAGPLVEKDIAEIDNDHAGSNLYDAHSWIIRGGVPADLYYTDSVNDAVVEFFAKDYTFTVELPSTLNYVGNVRLVVAEDGKEIATLSDAAFKVSSDVQLGKAGGTLKISLTEAGMKSIMSHVTDNSDAEIRIYYDTAINETAKAGVEIPSDVILTYTNSTNYTYDPVSVPDAGIPEVHTGGFRLEKVDSDDAKKLLEGAEFHIALTEADAKDEDWLKDGKGNEIVLTTNSNGIASYVGLGYDSLAKEPVGGTYYWIVETKAPEGYELDSTPARITINAATYDDDTAPYQIKNEVLKKAPMPNTGNDSTSMLWVLGLVLIAAGVSFAVVGTKLSRKKS